MVALIDDVCHYINVLKACPDMFAIGVVLEETRDEAGCCASCCVVRYAMCWVREDVLCQHKVLRGALHRLCIALV
jgi:hypothetical protein